MLKGVLIGLIVVGVAIIAILAVALFILTPPGTAPNPGTPPAGDGTLVGQVLLGPTCPVERIPPFPGCEPRPYATMIAIFAGGDTSAPYRTIVTDASGTFAVALPAGAYLIQPQSGSPLPRCASANVTVEAGATATTTLSCDTGIR